MEIDLAGALRPWVLTPGCDVPAGKMPRNATALIGRAIELGLRVRSTYAVALIPNVLRKIKGFTRIDGNEGADAKGGSMERVAVTLESIVVRVGAVDGWRAWLSWHCVDGAAWSFDRCWVRDVGHAPRRVSWDCLYIS